MTRTCLNCGTAYKPRRRDQVNCTKACSIKAANLEILRARALYRELYHWLLSQTREGRLQQEALAGVEGFTFQGNMGLVTRAGRHWIAEDRKKGRLPPPFPYDMQTAKLNLKYDKARETRK